MVTSHSTRLVESGHEIAECQPQLSLDNKLSMSVVLHVARLFIKLS